MAEADGHTAANDLLRHLAGRIEDIKLSSIRGFMCEEPYWAIGMLMDVLTARSYGADRARHTVPIDEYELELLDSFLTAYDSRELPWIDAIVVDSTASQLNYSFRPDLDSPITPEPGTSGNANILSWLDREQQSTPCRFSSVRQAWRTPLVADPQCPPGRVYVMELLAAEQANLSGIQACYTSCADAVGVEVVVEGEQLPPYQSAAFAAGREVWTARREPR